jgi:hypothetical protein
LAAVLQLRVYGAAPALDRIAERVGAVPGSRHVLVIRDDGADQGLVSADVSNDAADAAIAAVRELGVAEEDIELLRIDSIGPATASRALGGVVWADLLTQAGANARPLARYVVFMATAGVIAAFGVIYDNQILIVGAMAVSPDMLPITATCTALVLGRWGLSGRALATLAFGLAVSRPSTSRRRSSRWRPGSRGCWPWRRGRARRWASRSRSRRSRRRPTWAWRPASARSQRRSAPCSCSPSTSRC